MAAHDNNWMPLYIGDYLRDTTRLTVEQHGIYLLLIMDYWVNGPLPDDDKELLVIVRTFGRPSERSSKRALTELRQILCNFFTKSSQKWHHKRIDFERARSRAAYEQKCRAGLASAASRRSNNGTAQPNKRSNGRSNSVRDSVRTQLHCKEEGLAPYVANPVSLTAAPCASPPLPSQGDGVAAPGAREGQAETVPPDEATLRLDETLAAVRGKLGVVDLPAPPPLEPRIVEFRARLMRLNAVAGSRLDGNTRWHAWEVLAQADALGDPSALSPAMLDELAAIESLGAAE